MKSFIRHLLTYLGDVYNYYHCLDNVATVLLHVDTHNNDPFTIAGVSIIMQCKAIMT